MWTHILVLALAVGQAFEAAKASRTEAERVARLVAQLGSSKFKDRESATQELNLLGASALPALRQAALARDPEVCHRADILSKQIQQRLEIAQLLEPKRIRLVYENTPLSEVVADIAAKTGLTVQLEAADRHRRITLDTGMTTFWEAFDKFCQRAELVERVPPPPQGQDVRIWNARGRVGGQVLIVDSSASAGATAAEDRVTLVAGKPQLAPICYAGAVRIKALPAAGKALGQTKDEALVLFEVAPQPRLAWQGTLEVRIDQAIDEHGQKLFPALTVAGGNGEQIARRVGNGVVIVDAETGRLITGGREFPIRLQRGKKPSQLLKGIKGAVTGQVKTPMQAILTVNNILTAAGQTFKGTDGTTLKVLEATRLQNDHVRLKLRMEGSPELANLGGNRRVFRGGRLVMRAGGIRGNNPNDSQLALLDADGKSFLVSETESNWEGNGTRVVQEIETVYYPHSGQGEPVRLVYSSRRLVTVEVPFTLNNVPLP